MLNWKQLCQQLLVRNLSLHISKDDLYPLKSWKLVPHIVLILTLHRSCKKIVFNVFLSIVVQTLCRYPARMVYCLSVQVLVTGSLYLVGDLLRHLDQDVWSAIITALVVRRPSVLQQPGLLPEDGLYINYRCITWSGFCWNTEPLVRWSMPLRIWLGKQMGDCMHATSTGKTYVYTDPWKKCIVWPWKNCIVWPVTITNFREQR